MAKLRLKFSELPLKVDHPFDEYHPVFMRVHPDGVVFVESFGNEAENITGAFVTIDLGPVYKRSQISEFFTNNKFHFNKLLDGMSLDGSLTHEAEDAMNEIIYQTSMAFTDDVLV